MRPNLLLKTLAAMAVIVSVPRAGAQDTAVVRGPVAPLFEQVVTVSGDSVDKLRIAQLEGRAPSGGMFLRSTSSITDPRRTG